MNKPERSEPVRTVVVGIGHPTRALYADLDYGEQTAATTDPAACLVFDQLEHHLRYSGTYLDLGEPTATTLAAVAEARRVRPRVDKWQNEVETGCVHLRLPRPSETIAAPLSNVLERRRSSRRFGPLDPQHLSTLLYHSARVHDFLPTEDGYPGTTRAAPSAGARHPIDLILVPSHTSACDQFPGANNHPYLFDPVACDLIALAPSDTEWLSAVPSTVEMLLGSQPPFTIVLGARIERTFSRYRGGMSLVYRDAGAVLAILSTVASSLDLRCCAIATPTGAETSSKWLDVGGIAIGGVPG